MTYRDWIIDTHPWASVSPPSYGFIFLAQHKEFDYTTDEGMSHPTFSGATEQECIEQVDEWYEDQKVTP